MKTLKSSLLLAAMSVLAFTGCKDDNTAERPGGFYNNPVRFSYDATNRFDLTKATETGFEDLDAIGVYMKDAGSVLSNTTAQEENMKYVTNGSGLFTHATESDAIYFPNDGSNVDFIAYYPYETTITDFKYPVDISNQSNVSAIDLLYTNNATNLNQTANEVKFQFTHALSRAIFNIKEEAGANLTGLTVTIVGLPNTADFSLVDKTFSNPGNIADFTPAVSLTGTTLAKTDLMVIPTIPTSNVTVKFELGGETYLWAFPDSKSFQAGKKHTWDITLEADGTVTVVAPEGEISDWGDVDEGSVTIPKENATPGDGSQGNPFSAAEAIAAGTASNVWVEAYIVGAPTTGRSTFTNDSQILIADNANESVNGNCIIVELPDGSEAKAKLNLVDNPNNLGTKITVEGDLAGIAVYGATLTGLTGFTGGGLGGGGSVGEPEEFFRETFGPDYEGASGSINKSFADFMALNQCDMVPPYVYTNKSLDETRLDVRRTNSVPHPHLWFAANYNTAFEISGIETGYTSMTLSYDLASNKGSADYAGVMVRCNGTDVTIPTGTLSSTTNTFETITFDIPDNTTTIEFYATPTSNPTGAGYRLDNIVIVGAK